jgi:autotransporter-associated beta strand protein
MQRREGNLQAFNSLDRPAKKSAKALLQQASLAAFCGVAVLPVFYPHGTAHAGTISNIYALGLTGAGVDVAQVEGNIRSLPNDEFEDNPTFVSQTIPFEFIDVNGHTSTAINASYTISSTTYTDTVSDHAENVGNYFYGNTAFGKSYSTTSGAAYGVSRVDNYDAQWFQNDVILSGTGNGQTFIPNPLAHSDAVINQSFDNGSASAAEIQEIDSFYDYYNNYYTDAFTNSNGGTFGTIFVSAIGNGGQTSTSPASDINPPATMYNGIAVGVYDNGPSGVTGPTYDGRSKPDLVASAGEASYSTPQVSAAAAIMVQAGGLGPQISAGNYAGPVGYSGAVSSNGNITKAQYETDAMDERTVKALLLNGADKPVGWAHTYTKPLDINYGSGILDVYNSYANLAGGRWVPSIQNTSTTPISTPTINALEGWDFNSLNSSGNTVSHYVFNPAVNSGVAGYNLTATLVWNSQVASAISGNNVTLTEQLSNLYLELYDVTTSTRVDYSDSTVDNVQQLNTAGLNPGNVYDLEVYDAKGTNLTSTIDPYALAFNFQHVSTSASLYWDNASPNGLDNGLWDVNKSANWNDTTDGITSVVYSDADNVNFDDAHNPRGSYNVTLNTTVHPGSVTVNNSSGNYVISGTGSIAGSANLLKEGSDSLTLSTANTYTGSTTINGGTLALSGSGSIADSTLINVESGGTLNVSAVSFTLGASATQTLEGNGNVTGNVTIGAGGNLSPGDAIGPLTVNGVVTLGGTFSAQVDPTNSESPPNDQLAVTGGSNNVILGGALNVTTAPGTLANGDSYTLISAAGTDGIEDGSGIQAAFSSVSLPTLNAGLSWNTTLMNDNPAEYQNNYTISVTNTVPNGFTLDNPEYTAALTTGQSYQGYYIQNLSGRNTDVQFLAGTVSTGTNLAVQFANRSGSNPDMISDVATISGTGTDTYVLELNYIAADVANGTLSPVLAVEHNNVFEAAVLLDSTQHEVAGAYNPSTDDVLGDYGIDPTNHEVWAVLDYSGGDEFGVYQRIPGDLTGSGTVTPSDLGLVQTNLFGSTGGLWSRGDFQGAGLPTDTVTPGDLALVQTNLFATEPMGSAVGGGDLITSSPVPEPGSLALLGMGFLPLLTARRRHRKS